MQFEHLTSASFPSEIARAYHEWSAANGGDTPANQAAAQNYLSSLGINQNTIEAAYNAYQAPVASVRQAPVAAPTPAPAPAPVYQAPVAPASVYQAPVAQQSLSRASSPAEIASAYKQWAAANGGDTTENQRAAESHLLSLGIHQNVINAAYDAYKAPAAQTAQQGTSHATTPVTPQPLYAGLNNNSSASDIANAYRQWSSANGGDTTENQRASESYLQSLGIGSGAINDAYNAYKAPQPLYAGLNNNSSASDIANAYRQWSSANGGDTTENQRAAESYLQSLGIGSGAINDAYSAYRGPLTTVPAATTPAQNNPATPMPGPLTTAAPDYKMPVLNALYQNQQQRMFAPAPTFNFQQQLGSTAPAQPGSQAGFAADAPQPGALTTAISAP